jgi:hypothetical protein
VLRKIDEPERERMQIQKEIDALRGKARIASGSRVTTEDHVCELLDRFGDDLARYDRARPKDFLGRLLEHITLDPDDVTLRLNWKISVARRVKVASPRRFEPAYRPERASDYLLFQALRTCCAQIVPTTSKCLTGSKHQREARKLRASPRTKTRCFPSAVLRSIPAAGSSLYKAGPTDRWIKVKIRPEWDTRRLEVGVNAVTTARTLLFRRIWFGHRIVRRRFSAVPLAVPSYYEWHPNADQNQRSKHAVSESQILGRSAVIRLQHRLQVRVFDLIRSVLKLSRCRVRKRICSRKSTLVGYNK